MSKYIEFEFCELPDTPREFDRAKFDAGDPVQIKLYKDNKVPRRKKKLTYDDIMDEDKLPNYARVVPEGCMFIDFDNPTEAEEMYDIITHSGLRCLILETTKGYHFLFRVPEFYKKEMTGATNWFGYKFDTKGPGAVQIIRVCGMTRDERCSWEISELVSPEVIDVERLDVLPYWLWGKLKDTDLHKKGKPGESEYTLTDTPFTQLMTMKEGGRHNHIVEKCSMFGLSNGFEIDEFKSLITAIHDQYLIKLGDPMPDSDLFGDLEDRWEGYRATLESSGWSYDEKDRKWKKAKSKKDDKLDERRAAEWLFTQYDFYGNNKKIDGTFDGLLYKEIGGPYEYSRDITVFRETLKEHSDQNFKDTFFKEVEVQLMQMCASHNKIIARNDKYIIVKNKVLSCITPDAYEFGWIGTRPPTDVVLPWNWYPESWVAEHEEDLGGLITNFIKQLSRNSRGIPQKEVEDWLWILAGASMIPANQLQKIAILSGGGQNGKSLFTSLIRLCLGEYMFNESKIFDSSPHDGFWGEGLDKGILCVIDDLNRVYSRDAFSYIKGAITGTDSVVINEKFKAKKRLDILPQIIACTNFEFELYDKSEGMKRRVLILPTEYHIDDSIKDTDLQHKLVLNTMDKVKVAEYKMSEDSFNHKGVKVMNMYTGEKGVLDSLDNGSLAWFANKARYMYLHWILGELKVESSEGMKERMEGVFSGGFEAELTEFLDWYITERKESIWTKELYGEYVDWHNEMATGDTLMNERAFARNLTKAINAMLDKGYKVKLKKTRNEKGMTLNKLFIGEDAVDDK